MTIHRINLTINGSVEQVDVPSNLTLLQMLREKLALTGTKNGCMAGECGACTVMLNGEPVNSCMVLAVECDGAEVLTVEGLVKDGVLDPIQETIIDQGGVQCGFCTPGILISARALLEPQAQTQARPISGKPWWATCAAAPVIFVLSKRCMRRANASCMRRAATSAC